jgi:hypothetical protein
LLTSSGHPSTVNDTLLLQVSGLPSTSVCTFFQATSAGAASIFGDGLRCTAGTLVRLRTVTAVNGAANFPGPGDPLVHVQGGVFSDGTWTYQVSYRNAANYCSPATFNISNGLSVLWAQ